MGFSLGIVDLTFYMERSMHLFPSKTSAVFTYNQSSIAFDIVYLLMQQFNSFLSYMSLILHIYAL